MTDQKDAEIARYDLDLMASRMVKDQWGGGWVRYSDHAAEIARLRQQWENHDAAWSERVAALTAEIARLTAANEQLQYIATANQTRAEKAEAERDAALARVKEMEAALTPLTDAKLNALVGILAGTPLYEGSGDETSIGEVAADVITALRARPAGVTVKPLAWHSKSEWHHYTDPEPGSPGNSQKMQYVIKHYVMDGGQWDLYGPGHWGPGNKFPSLEAAKAAAQADYEARIRAALLPAGEGE